jgi:hypothetical protein
MICMLGLESVAPSRCVGKGYVLGPCDVSSVFSVYHLISFGQVVEETLRACVCFFRILLDVLSVVPGKRMNMNPCNLWLLIELNWVS